MQLLLVPGLCSHVNVQRFHGTDQVYAGPGYYLPAKQVLAWFFSLSSPYPTIFSDNMVIIFFPGFILLLFHLHKAVETSIIIYHAVTYASLVPLCAGLILSPVPSSISGLLVVCRFLQQSPGTPLCQPVERPAVQENEQGEQERTHQVAT